MELSEHTRRIIEGIYIKRKHMRLTLGFLKDGDMETVTYDESFRPIDGLGPCYAVGSIAKPFTASLLAKYIADGKLDLNAPLSEYIQALPEGYYPSLRRLATHSSGYGGQPYTLLPALKMFLRRNKSDGLFRVNPYHWTMDEGKMLETLANTPLRNKEYKYFYSNFAFGVLGYILGSVGGAGYWDELQSFISDELGLPRSYLGVTDDVPGYDEKNQPCVNWQWDKRDIIAAAGALVAPVEDLMKFAQINLDGSKPYLSLCHQKHGGGNKEAAIGLAWRLRRGTNISWHTGAAGAFSAFIGIDRDKQTAAAAACNYALVDMRELGFELLENGEVG